MAQQITEEQKLQASYPDPPQLITSKIPISRLDTAKGRVYYQRDISKLYLHLERSNEFHKLEIKSLKKEIKDLKKEVA